MNNNSVMVIIILEKGILLYQQIAKISTFSDSGLYHIIFFFKYFLLCRFKAFRFDSFVLCAFVLFILIYTLVFRSHDFMVNGEGEREKRATDLSFK